MKTLILAIIVGVLLLGCAHRPSGYWTKDKFDPAQWERDRYECKHDAEVVCQYYNPRVGVIPGAICVNNHFRDCIQVRGYYWVENPR